MSRGLLALAWTVLTGLSSAVAQPYPSWPVVMVVPYGAGGPTDTVARILGEGMRERLGQQVVIENVTGAAGTIGVGRAVRAAPDGYTVSIGNWSTHVVNGAIFTLQYDLLKDLEPVARLSSNPYVAVARKGLPVGDLKELVAGSRQVLTERPWELRDPGPGSTSAASIFRASPVHGSNSCPIALAPPRSCAIWSAGTSI